METVGWQDKIRRQLDIVQRWRQSGQSMAVWGAAHGVDAKLLMGWVSYEKRWRQRLGELPQQLCEDHAVGASKTPANIKVSVTAASHAASMPPSKAPPKARAQGFVAVRRSNAAPHCTMGTVHPSPVSVRIECAVAGVGTGLVLHWPLAQTQALAEWLKLMAAS